MARPLVPRAFCWTYRYPSGGPVKPLLKEDELRRAVTTIDILATRLRAGRPGIEGPSSVDPCQMAPAACSPAISSSERPSQTP